jgi:hypothetical protein
MCKISDAQQVLTKPVSLCAMAPVNWERHPGETVEEFVEALILTTVNPRATRITPSRGDKGVDIIAPVGDQFDVYQVKRYTRPFSKSSSQEKSIIKSWKRFVRDIMPAYPIRRWHLVMPWNPTPERYEWLRNDLTSGVSVINPHLPTQARWHCVSPVSGRHEQANHDME